MSLPSDFLVTEHQFCRLPPKGLNGVMIKEKRSAGLPEPGGPLGPWSPQILADQLTFADENVAAIISTCHAYYVQDLTTRVCSI